MHSHESEQVSYVLQGGLKFLVAGEEVTVREGEVLLIPSRLEHQAEALEDTFSLDIFSPIRQDWLDRPTTTSGGRTERQRCAAGPDHAKALSRNRVAVQRSNLSSLAYGPG